MLAKQRQYPYKAQYLGIMNCSDILKIIQNDEIKTLNSDELNFFSLSNQDIVSLLTKAADLAKLKDNNIIIEVFDRARGRELLAPLMDLIYSLDTDNFFEQLADFPASFRITNTQIFVPEILQANKSMFETLGVPYHANLYFSPNQSYPGLGLHYDTDPIFIHQIKGQKHWTLLNDYNDGKYLKENLEKFDLNKHKNNKTELILEEGQLLYMPPCIPHLPICINEQASLHLTYAIKQIPRKDDIMEFISDQMFENSNLGKDRFRPLVDDQETIVRHISDYFKTLDIEHMLSEFTKSQTAKKLYLFMKGYPYKKNQ